MGDFWAVDGVAPHGMRKECLSRSVTRTIQQAFHDFAANRHNGGSLTLPDRRNRTMKKDMVFTEEFEPPGCLTETVNPHQKYKQETAALRAGRRTPPHTGSFPQLSLSLPGAGGLRINPRTEEFRRRFYADITASCSIRRR
jgi:hypothetical protein